MDIVRKSIYDGKQTNKRYLALANTYSSLHIGLILTQMLFEFQKLENESDVVLQVGIDRGAGHRFVT